MFIVGKSLTQTPMNDFTPGDLITAYAAIGPVSTRRAHRAADVFAHLSLTKQATARRWITAQRGDLSAVADNFVHKLTINWA